MVPAGAAARAAVPRTSIVDGCEQAGARLKLLTGSEPRAHRHALGTLSVERFGPDDAADHGPVHIGTRALAIW